MAFPRISVSKELEKIDCFLPFWKWIWPESAFLLPTNAVAVRLPLERLLSAFVWLLQAECEIDKRPPGWQSRSHYSFFPWKTAIFWKGYFLYDECANSKFLTNSKGTSPQCVRTSACILTYNTTGHKRRYVVFPAKFIC